MIVDILQISALLETLIDHYARLLPNQYRESSGARTNTTGTFKVGISKIGTAKTGTAEISVAQATAGEIKLADQSAAQLAAAMLGASYPKAPFASTGSRFAVKVFEEAVCDSTALAGGVATSAGKLAPGMGHRFEGHLFDLHTAAQLLAPALEARKRGSLPKRLAEIAITLETKPFWDGLTKVDNARSAPELAEASRLLFEAVASPASPLPTTTVAGPALSEAGEFSSDQPRAGARPLIWRARFLLAAGRSCFPPTDRLLRTMERLGWLQRGDKKSGSFSSPFDESTRLAAMSLGERIGRATGRTPGEIALLLGALCGESFGPPPERALSPCGESPRCGDCPIQSACLFGRMRGNTIGQNRPVQPPRRGSKGRTLQLSTEQKEGRGRQDQPPSLRVDSLIAPDEEIAGADSPYSTLPMSSEGVNPLNEAALLATLLGGGQPHRRLVANVEELLRRVGGLDALAHLPADSPLLEEGLNRNRRAVWGAARALMRRLSEPRLQRGGRIGQAEDVYRAFHARLRLERQELFIALLLNTKNELLQEVELARGTLDAMVVHPRDAFRPAVVASAAGVIFLHNHPSGDPAPSSADRDTTRELREAGRLLRIPMLDHIIVGDGAYYSFHDDELVKMRPTPKESASVDAA